MQILTLGASGGLEPQQGTSAFYLPPHTLIDAGTGAQRLAGRERAQLHQVLLTHAHLDHVAGLPFLVDTQFEMLMEKEQILSIHALPAVLEILERHIFNGSVWPDFTRLPSAEAPVMRYVPIVFWQPLVLEGAAGQSLQATPFPLSHGVPNCGYCISDGRTRMAVCGDTGLSDTSIASLNRLGPLDRLIIECAFGNHLDSLAEVTYHLTPQRLKTLLGSLDTAPKELWITHLKPNQRSRIAMELHQTLPSTQHWELQS